MKRREAELHGEGTYVFRNNTSGDLMLTKPANDGRKSIPSKGEWEGDNYFMRYAECGEATLVRIIELPEEEIKGKEMNDKLILDQPDQVTVEGKVEQVMTIDAEAEVSITETGEQTKKDVLINEDPLEGVEIILD